MQLPEPLHPGYLVRRYKRFLADVRLESGETLTVHCPNPGRMTGVQDPGMRVWLSRSANSRRKLSYTLELVKTDGGLVGINTGRPNAIVAEAVQSGSVPELAGYRSLRREVKAGAGSRIDILLEDPDRARCWVEIKNVQLKRDDGPYPGCAEFPDAVTARGRRHLDVLSHHVAAGDRAVIFFLVQRMDCSGLAIAEHIDPEYGEGLRTALAAGVELLCYDCTMSTARITLRRRLPFVAC